MLGFFSIFVLVFIASFFFTRKIKQYIDIDRLFFILLNKSKAKLVSKISDVGIYAATDRRIKIMAESGEIYYIPIVSSQSIVKPITFISVKNENNIDVIEEFLLYFGPNKDFYGLSVTPAHLNYSRLHIVYISKKFTSKVFESSELITF